jgi:predicted ATPase with chaperone activity
MKVETVELNWKNPETKRMHEICGNESAKRALEVALTGSHEVVLLACTRAPASDLLRAAARIAQENGLPFKGKVVPVCPCGAYGTPKTECTCSAADMKQHAKKMMPLLHRIPMIIEVVEPRASETTQRNEPEATLVSRILASRKCQVAKNGCDGTAGDILKHAITEVGTDRQSAVDVASTIARMDERGSIQAHHITEAIQYQFNPMVRNWCDMVEEVKV